MSQRPPIVIQVSNPTAFSRQGSLIILESADEDVARRIAQKIARETGRSVTVRDADFAVIELIPAAGSSYERPIRLAESEDDSYFSKMSNEDIARFRAQAEECHEQAKRSIRPSDKEAWLKMANEWLSWRRMLNGDDIEVVSIGDLFSC